MGSNICCRKDNIFTNGNRILNIQRTRRTVDTIFTCAACSLRNRFTKHCHFMWILESKKLLNESPCKIRIKWLFIIEGVVGV